MGIKDTDQHLFTLNGKINNKVKKNFRMIETRKLPIPADKLEHCSEGDPKIK